MTNKTPNPFHLAALALITGAFLAITAGVIAVLLGERPWAWGVGIFTLTALVAWLGLLAWWRGLIEAQHGIKQIQPEPARPEPYKITVVAEDPSGAFMEGHYLEKPISDESLKNTCKVLSEGGDFSHASLAGPGKPLTRNQYERLRHAFLKAGLVYWKDDRAHAQGLKLTLAGKRVVTRIANEDNDSRKPPPQNGRFSPIDDHPGRYPHAHARHTSDERRPMADNYKATRP